MRSRAAHAAELVPEVHATLAQRSARDWEEIFGERVPCAAVRPIEDMFDHPQVLAEELVTTLDHAGKQLALDALGVSVAIYARGRSPRFVITARIPLVPTASTTPESSTTPRTTVPSPSTPPETVPTSPDPDEQAGTPVSPSGRAWLRGAAFSRTARLARRAGHRVYSSADSIRDGGVPSAVVFWWTDLDP